MIILFITHFAFGTSLFSQIKRNNVITFFLLIASTQFADILFGIFAFIGLENGSIGGTVEMNLFNVPWSHSFLMIIFWSILYGSLAYFIVKSLNEEEAILVGTLSAIGVFSHWIFDIIVHNNDMLLDPFTKIHIPTLYLWQIPLLSFFIELILTILFWIFYYVALRENYKIGLVPFLGVGLLVLYHTFSFFSASDSQPSTEVTGFSGLFLSLLVLFVVVFLTIIHYYSVHRPISKVTT